jgi:hypothetical protein
MGGRQEGVCKEYGTVTKWKAIAWAIVIIILVSASLYAFYQFNGKSLDFTNRQVLLIVTDSMDGDVTEYEIDSFPSNTFVMIKHLTDEEKLQLQIGDVISFHYNGDLIHHRIIETHFDKGYLITHGDNTHANETVPLSDINGKVVGTNHWFGEVVSWVKAHFLYLIAAIAIFAISGEIYRAYKDGVFKKEG